MAGCISPWSLIKIYAIHNYTGKPSLLFDSGLTVALVFQSKGGVLSESRTPQLAWCLLARTGGSLRESSVRLVLSGETHTLDTIRKILYYK